MQTTKSFAGPSAASTAAGSALQGAVQHALIPRRLFVPAPCRDTGFLWQHPIVCAPASHFGALLPLT